MVKVKTNPDATLNGTASVKTLCDSLCEEGSAHVKKKLAIFCGHLRLDHADKSQVVSYCIVTFFILGNGVFHYVLGSRNSELRITSHSSLENHITAHSMIVCAQNTKRTYVEVDVAQFWHIKTTK